MNTSQPEIEFVVISGMAKTGTTLPLTLLDGHPDLTVFPEELRFFHLGCHKDDGEEAACRLLNNVNIKNLSLKDEFFDKADYLAHGGTGFGKKDYKNFNFEKFSNLIRQNFKRENSPYKRFLEIIHSYILANEQCDALPEKIIFVSKAPHNEVYIYKWENMLGESVKHVLCTRLPTEHYSSLKNVANLQNKDKNIYKYIFSVEERLRFWNKFPENRTFILDYDKLISEPESTMRSLSDFLSIPYNECMSKPTKFGVPWAGNSSRGIVKEKIFKNTHIAEDTLNREEFEAIEYLLESFYKRNNWNRSHKSLTKSKKIQLTIKYFCSIALLKTYKVQASIKSLISGIIPEPAIQKIKALIRS